MDSALALILNGVSKSSMYLSALLIYSSENAKFTFMISFVSIYD